jgi:hypothetical protein
VEIEPEMVMIAIFGLDIKGIEINAPKTKPSTAKKRIDQSQRRNNLLADSSLGISIFLVDSYLA